MIRETEMAGRLENGIADVIAEGEHRTWDMGRKTTTEMAGAIAARLK